MHKDKRQLPFSWVQQLPDQLCLAKAKSKYLVLVLVKQCDAKVAGDFCSQVARSRWQLIQSHAQLPHSSRVVGLPQENIANICPVLCSLRQVRGQAS